MAHIKPFCAVRPNLSIATEFCSKPISLYDENELKTTLKNQPNSFLQIIKSNIKSPKQIANNERFIEVKNQYQKFKNKGLLSKDNQEGFYIQEIKMNNQTFTGIVAVASVEDYKKGHIKKHEDTIESKENIFKNYLKTTRFNTEPVLLTYKNQTSISDLIHKIKKQPATVNLKISDLETQKLWAITSKVEIEIICEGFKNIDGLALSKSKYQAVIENYFNKIAEKEVNHNRRKYGVTKFGMERYIRGFLDLLSVSFVYRFRKRPMHFFGSFGVLSFLLGFISAGFIIYEKISKLSQNVPLELIRPVTDQPLFYIALLAIIIGVQ